MELNQSQAKACQLQDGPALVLAGAGTGKTHTLTQRLVYLIKEKKVKAENILVLTFTNKASQEMRERAEKKLGKGSLQNLFLGTFHQLGLKILRQEMDRLNLNPDLLIYDPAKEDKFFDDLILLPISIFKKYPEVLCKYQKIFIYILVDEYQDIDQAQYELLKLLASSHNNLWTIGDSDQAIYSFRGGNLENFLEFKRDFPEAEFVTLRENYRSTEIILKAGQGLIEKNTRRMEKELCPTIKGGANVSLWIQPDEKAEARAIIREIERLLGGTSHYEIYKAGKNLGENSLDIQSFSDFAVLYRLHTQGQMLAKEFEESGIPYQLVGQSKKKDIDSTDLEKVLLKDIDFFDERADAVSLMTLHAAKGLEFPVVFITGLEDEILPYKKGKENLEDYEEERRLLYVGITRAKRKLYLLLAKSRFLYGERKKNLPSPFLRELPEDVLEKRQSFKKRKARERQMSLWKD